MRSLKGMVSGVRRDVSLLQRGPVACGEIPIRGLPFCLPEFIYVRDWQTFSSKSRVVDNAGRLVAVAVLSLAAAA